MLHLIWNFSFSLKNVGGCFGFMRVMIGATFSSSFTYGYPLCVSPTLSFSTVVVLCRMESINLMKGLVLGLDVLVLVLVCYGVVVGV